MVIAVTPTLHLFCQAIADNPPRWHFVLQDLEGSNVLDVTDAESGVDGERLELLALVRGLEAIWCPARLIVVSPSRYIRHGLQFGLNDWRRQDWRWERFGELVPIKNADLWQRVDAALRFHELEVARHQMSTLTGPTVSSLRVARVAPARGSDDRSPARMRPAGESRRVGDLSEVDMATTASP
ncbi:MAG: hypothetical protein DWQ42_02830 [Planctomycetota bacterium]|nr:MAG: hypothetical protein DWQ42_02830 [Planctomycetota bacterium]REK47975.1 MAG: hypothetical protein DWQ46_03525 [Planctomycetota bacterium]